MSNPLDAGQSLSLAVLNPANNQALVYRNTPTSLKLTLTNRTGDAVDLKPGVSMDVFMPLFFKTAEIDRIVVAQAGWAFTHIPNDPNNPQLTLSYTGAPGAWANNASLEFTLANVACGSQPDSDYVQVNFTDADVNADVNTTTFTAPFFVADAPVRNAKLSSVLRASFDNQGQIYVSRDSAQDPLSNILFLNLKNVGDTPLKWAGNAAPIVEVSFVYGRTAGALTHDNRNPSSSSSSPIGRGGGAPGGSPAPSDAAASAWNIDTRVVVAGSSNPWTKDTPRDVSNMSHPTWTFTSSSVTKEAIGTGDASNVTLAFQRIVTEAPTGHTQAYLRFRNFADAAGNPYDDEIVVLDIVKQDPPTTRGITSLYSPSKVVFDVMKPNDSVEIPLKWSMLYVNKVNIITSYPGLGVIERTYPDPPALNYDSHNLLIPGVSSSMPIFVTVQGFNGLQPKPDYLNSAQFTAVLNAAFMIDPRDTTKTPIPIVRIGNRYWMARNLWSEATTGFSGWSGGNSGNEAKYGRLYSADAAVSNAPPGWRLPTQKDWQELFAALGGDPFGALAPGGSAKFNAQFGGFLMPPSRAMDLDRKAYYWTATPNPRGDMRVCAVMDTGRRTVSVDATYPKEYGCSVRYVRDI